MSAVSPPDWADALAAVERAIAEQTVALNEYERRYATVLAEPSPVDGPRLAIVRNDDPAGGWDERIATANARANTVERQLADQQAACGRWREAFTAWERSLQQSPGESAAD